MAGLIWLAEADLGPALDSLPWLGVETRGWSLLCQTLQSARHTADSRGFGTAINHA
jgi:hypothetical protein